MFLATNRDIYDKILRMVQHYGMPFLLERSVSVIVRESSSEYEEESMLWRGEFAASSVKRSKDENLPPQTMISKLEYSEPGSKESFKLPDSIVIPLNSPEIASKSWNES
jgi:hypothetical protein